MGTRLNEGKLARALLQYRNTPSCRDGLSPAQKLFGRPVTCTEAVWTTCHLHRSCLDGPFRTHFQPTTEPSPQSGNTVWKKLTRKHSCTESKSNNTTTNTPEPSQRFKLAPMLPFRTPPLNCGTYTALLWVLAHTDVTTSRP